VSSIPAQVPPSVRCVHHPQREGVGICVQCRQVICAECSTRVDGMNYCVRCLEQAAARPRAATPAGPRPVGAGLLLLGSSMVSVGLFVLLGMLLAAVRQFAPGGLSPVP
jgi:hypothetical protein